MKFRVERDVLAEAVTWVARGTPGPAARARPRRPAAGGRPEGVLRLSSFDYEVSARVEVPPRWPTPGTVLVSGRLLADISRVAARQAGRRRDRRLQGGPHLRGEPLHAADHAGRRLPDAAGVADGSGTIGGDVFTQAVAQVTVAASRDETLPILTGVRMEIEGERLTLLATDRYRLAMRTLPWRPAAPDTSAVALVRARTLTEVSKALGVGRRRHAGAEHRLGQRAHRLRGGRPAHDVAAGRRRVPQGARAVPGGVRRPRGRRHAPAARGRPARLARGRAEHPGAARLHRRRGHARGRPGRGRPGVRGRRVRAARRGPVDRVQPGSSCSTAWARSAPRSPGSRSPCRRSPPSSPGRPRSRARTTTATGTCSCPCAWRASTRRARLCGAAGRGAVPACPAINAVAGLAHTSAAGRRPASSARPRVQASRRQPGEVAVHIGLVGLGKMGGNMRERLRNAGIEVTGYDRNPDISDAGSLEELVKALPAPRLVWVMVPAGAPDRRDDRRARAACSRPTTSSSTAATASSPTTPGTPRSSARRASTSSTAASPAASGAWRTATGSWCGGDDADVERAMPVFDALRPEGPREEGFVHAGIGRRRPLREDGPQRHRVRPDAGLRRGLRAAPGEGHRHRRPRLLPGLDARHRRPLLAARPAGEGARSPTRS